MNDLVSIIVPVYNVEKYVLKCLKSLAGQTYKNIEVVVIDDGSTDGSGLICDDFKDKRFKVFHKKNGGLSSARNLGIKKAKGNILAFVDSDDFVKKDFIEKMLNCMVGNIDIVVCGYNDERPKEEVLSGREATIRLLTEQENIDLITCNKLYRKSLFLDNNIWFPEGKKHEDTLTTYKLLSRSEKVQYILDSLYEYVVRDGSIMHSGKKEEQLEMRELAAREAIEYFKNDKELEQAAEICLLWAKYHYLNEAIFGHIDKKYEQESLKWLKENVEKYRNNKFLTKKLYIYNMLSTFLKGSGYRVFRKIIPGGN